MQSGLDLGVPVNTVTESVFARSASGHRRLRAATRVLSGPDGALPADHREALVERVRSALWASKVVAYAQVLDQIRAASEAYGWDVDLSEVARIWRGGCIIRARLLERIRQEYAAQQLPTLLAAPSVVTGLGQAEGRWRSVVAQAVSAGIPVPGFSAALAYYDTVRAPRLPAAWCRVCATSSEPTPTDESTARAPSTQNGRSTGPRPR